MLRFEISRTYLILKKIHILAVVFILCNTALFAQDLPNKVELNSGNYTIFHWTTENGLPQNNIQNLRMGRNNLIWMSTYDGIAQFDGNRFKLYDQGTINALSSSFIYKMESDEANNMWFTTYQDLCIIDSSQTYVFDFESYGKINLLSWGEKPYLEVNGKLWSLQNGILTPFNLEKPSSSTYTFVSDFSLPLINTKDSIFCFDDNGHLTRSFKCDRFWKVGSDYIKIENNGEIRLEFIDQSAKTDMSQIDFYKAEDIESYHLLEGDLEVLETNDSIKIFEKDRLVFAESKGRIGIRRIRTALRTRDNQIWLGTGESGLFLLQPKVFNSYTNSNLTVKTDGYFVFSDDSINVYFDAGCGEIGKIDKYLNVSTQEISGCAWTMLYDLQGHLWVNGAPEDSSIVSRDHFDNIKEGGVQSSFLKSDGSIYIGTSKGLVLVKAGKSLIIEGTESLSNIYHIAETKSNGVIFCGTDGIGLIEDDKLVGHWNKSNGLATSDIRTVYQDSSGYFWFGYSKSGLGFFDGKTLFNFPHGQGRLNKNVWTIIEDDHGNFWMNSNQGIYCANRIDLIDFARGKIPDFSSRHYSVADGLANAEGNSRTQNKGFKDSQGRIWFSMISGPSYIDPSILEDQDEYPIVLNNVYLDGQEELRPPYIMHPNSEFIKFEFTQSNLNRSSQARYFYKFKGEKDSWRPVGKSKEITLNNPEPGNHILLIKKSGSDEKLEIPFEVQVHFWETNLFSYLIVFFITALLSFSLFRVYRSRRQSEAKMKKVNSELKRLELRALQSQMNPHFIFNCLSSISALYLSGKPAAANDYLSRFSSLLRIILEHAQHRLISLKDDLEMFEIYVPLEGLQFDEPFDFELNVDLKKSASEIYIPSMVTHTFIENAIKHGLKPLKEGKGKLIISVVEENNRVLIHIQDNGIGYENSILYKRKMTKLHKSRGLENTNKRINLINLLNDLDIKVQTKNLLNSEGSACGTRVTVSIPIIDKNENTNS